MHVAVTHPVREVVIPSPPRLDADGRVKPAEVHRLVVTQPTVYVEYDRFGKSIEYKVGGSTWVC